MLYACRSGDGRFGIAKYKMWEISRDEKHVAVLAFRETYFRFTLLRYCYIVIINPSVSRSACHRTSKVPCPRPEDEKKNESQFFYRLSCMFVYLYLYVAKVNRPTKSIGINFGFIHHHSILNQYDIYYSEYLSQMDPYVFIFYQIFELNHFSLFVEKTYLKLESI